MDLFTTNMPEALIALGILAIAIEAGILGFATLFLLFVGLGTLFTGIAMRIGLLDASWTTALVSVGLSSVILAIVAWQPMRRLQEKVHPQRQTSDFVGLSFNLTSELSADQLSSYRYSGILWTVKPGAKLPQPLPKGTKVVVTAVEVGGLYVVAENSSTDG
ncbi:NfeD family protein [Neptunicella sp. SCSIO 80796]|uniref:NfeD family protein n=1 Tax=Neptunicella plasticusilytica TaxID=3117012 RepID=UPI003A4D1D51